MSCLFFFFSSRRRHTILTCDWSSDVCSSDLQPIARTGIELIRGSASDSALDSLLERALIERNAHQLFLTTRAFLDLMGLRGRSEERRVGKECWSGWWRGGYENTDRREYVGRM